MTIREAMLEAWELCGKRTDLEPFGADPGDYDTGDIADSFGTRYWLRQFTQAERVITSYMKRGVRPLRFDGLIEENLIKLEPFTIANFDRVTLTADVNSSLNALDYRSNVIYWDGLYTVSGNVGTYNLDVFTVTNFGMDDEQELVGASVEIGGNDYTIESIVINGGNYQITLTEEISGVSLSEAISIIFTFAEFSTFILSATDDGTDTTFVLKDSISIDLPAFFNVTLYLNNYRYELLSLPTTFRHILKIVDVDSASKLAKSKRKESFYLDAENSQGVPETWEQRGGRIYFDTSVDDELNLKFEILTVPPTLDDVDDEFFVSEPFHVAIVAYANWRTAERSQEFDKAFALKRDFQELMNTITTESASDFYRDDTYGVYRITDTEEI